MELNIVLEPNQNIDKQYVSFFNLEYIISSQEMFKNEQKLLIRNDVTQSFELCAVMPK